jgi:nucleotide-binding universal stress UspA family protein
MMPFRKILFPVDFSEATVAMVPYVAEVAQRFSGTVTILNAFNRIQGYSVAARLEGSFDSEPVSIPYTDALQGLRTQRQKRLEEFCRSHFSNVNHMARLEDGDAATVVEWVAKHENTDLIMMPTKGFGKFRRWLLGSITAKVLHDVDCLVMTSAHVTGSEFASPNGFRSIVCSVELNPEAHTVLEAAGDLAHAYGAKLHLLHIETSRERGEQVTAQSITQAFKEASGSDMVVEATLLHTGVADGIRRVALENSADLVVVGRGRQKGISRIWTHLYAIIAESPCPVLSV